VEKIAHNKCLLFSFKTKN